MRFAIIGTGFVVDYYMTTLAHYPGLTLAGVYDSDAARLKQFCDYYSVTAYASQADVLADDSVELVVVLTTPETHYAISRAALEAGKHVYCEKPLAMRLPDAEALVVLAEERGLALGGAPANALSSAFGLVEKTLSSHEIGAPKLVYVEMEDGPVFRDNWQSWRSQSGAPWPGRHEFEIGCTLEHAGYGLSWLIGLFGPIREMTGTSGTFFMDKGAPIAPQAMAPDFSTACLTFESGVVARLTCGLCAPKDRSMIIMAEQGTLTVADLWDDRSAVFVEAPANTLSFSFRVARRLEAILGHVLPLRLNAGRRLRYGDKTAKRLPGFPSQIDFCAGLDALVAAADNASKRQAMAARALHVTEAALVLNRLSEHGGVYTMHTRL
ncbi:MAG: Gfo/Idh/MocA family oxidoreductase [Ahrensia sp.]